MPAFAFRIRSSLVFQGQKSVKTVVGKARWTQEIMLMDKNVKGKTECPIVLENYSRKDPKWNRGTI